MNGKSFTFLSFGFLLVAICIALYVAMHGLAALEGLMPVFAGI